MRWVDYCGHSLLLLFRHGIFFGSGRVGDKAWLDLIECHSVAGGAAQVPSVSFVLLLFPVIYVRTRVLTSIPLMKLSVNWPDIDFGWLPPISHQRIDWHMITASGCHSPKAFILAASAKHRKQRPQKAPHAPRNMLQIAFKRWHPLVAGNKGGKTQIKNRKPKSPSKWKMEMCKAAQQGLHLASIFIF